VAPPQSAKLALFQTAINSGAPGGRDVASKQLFLLETVVFILVAFWLFLLKTNRDNITVCFHLGCVLVPERCAGVVVALPFFTSPLCEFPTDAMVQMVLPTVVPERRVNAMCQCQECERIRAENYQRQQRERERRQLVREDKSLRSYAKSLKVETE
jgi:hypothetical protein